MPLIHCCMATAATIAPQHFCHALHCCAHLLASAVDESMHSLQQLLLLCCHPLMAESHCCILNSFLFPCWLAHYWLISLKIYDVITPLLAAQQQQCHCCAAHFLCALRCCAQMCLLQLLINPLAPDNSCCCNATTC